MESLFTIAQTMSAVVIILNLHVDYNYNNCFAITCFLVSVCLDTSITVKLYQACMRVVSLRKVPFLQLNFIIFVLHICIKLAIIDLFSLIMLLIKMCNDLFILIFSMLPMRMTVLASFSIITSTIAGAREASSSAAVSASCAGLEAMCATLTAHHIDRFWRHNRRWINGWHRYSILHLPATCTYSRQ